MDRASGSGVFARDPDALLDMIQLPLDKVRATEIGNRMTCDLLCKELDRLHPSWRGACPQDDAVVLEKLQGFMEDAHYDDCRDYCDDCLTRYKKMTAWRLTFTLREFAAPDPVNFLFAWPVHEIDSSGMLDDLTEDGAKPLFKTKKDEPDLQGEKLMKIQMVFSDFKKKGGQVTVESVAKELGMQEESVRYHIKRTSKQTGLHISKGIIYED